MDTTAQEYKTKDFWLAVTIKSLGYTLKRLEPDEFGKGFYYFIFDDTDSEIKTKVEWDYLNSQIRVEPRDFVNISKEFKRRINSD